jgi:hypothetical protein
MICTGDPSAESWAMTVRLIKHEAVPKCGSIEVRFPNGRPSRYLYWEDLPSRRLRPDLLTGEEAERDAKELARAEQDKLGTKFHVPSWTSTRNQS